MYLHSISHLYHVIQSLTSSNQGIHFCRIVKFIMLLSHHSRYNLSMPYQDQQEDSWQILSINLTTTLLPLGLPYSLQVLTTVSSYRTSKTTSKYPNILGIKLTYVYDSHALLKSTIWIKTFLKSNILFIPQGLPCHPNIAAKSKYNIETIMLYYTYLVIFRYLSNLQHIHFVISHVPKILFTSF